jgi:hypothetical protein
MLGGLSMRWRAFHWYDLLLPIFAILFPIWTYALSWAADTHQRGHNPDNEFAEALASIILAFKYIVPFLLFALIVIVNLVKVAKDAAPKRTVRSFLKLLHETYFPYTSGGLNPQYRVSLFIPTRWPRWKFLIYPTAHRYLILYARSGDLFPKTKLKWDITASEEGKYDGIAGNAWVTGIFVHIPDLPPFEEGTEADRQRYMRLAFLTPEKAYKLNIRSRSYQALVIKNRMGEKVALLMMECVEPNGLMSLTAEKWGEIAKTLQCLASA